MNLFRPRHSASDTDQKHPNSGQQWAHVHATPEFIDIVACSSYRLHLANRALAHYQVDPTTSDAELGAALVVCLTKSDNPSLEEHYKLSETNSRQYEAWVTAVRKRYNYDSRKALFRNMRSVIVRADRESIGLLPSHHDKLESWAGMPENMTVTLDKAASPGQIGAALRKALERCTSRW